MRISTNIERRVNEMLTAEKTEALLPIMTDRRGDTPRGDVMLTTNVYGVKMANNLVYRYDVAIKGIFTKRDGSEKQDDLTNKIKGE